MSVLPGYGIPNFIEWELYIWIHLLFEIISDIDNYYISSPLASPRVSDASTISFLSVLKQCSHIDNKF